MKCVLCRNGETKLGTTTVTLEREGVVVVVKNVPADVCENCGEFYVAGPVTERLLARAEIAVSNGAEVEILHYAA